MNIDIENVFINKKEVQQFWEYTHIIYILLLYYRYSQVSL